MEFHFPHRHSEGFDALYGLETLELTEEIVRGQVVIGEQHLQPGSLVHGGVYAAIAESLASWGTTAAVMPGGQVGVGLSNHTSFMRPITGGVIHALARRRHRGRTTWVWEVDITDDQDRLCVISRVTIAVRDL